MNHGNGGHLVWCACGRAVYTQTEGLSVRHMGNGLHEYTVPSDQVTIVMP